MAIAIDRPNTVIDSMPLNKLNWAAFKEAAAELARIAKESTGLALRTGDQTLIAEAKKSFAMVTGL